MLSGKQRKSSPAAALSARAQPDTFTIHLPADIAARIRYLAQWEQKTPEGLIAEAIIGTSVGILDAASTSAAKTQSRDVKRGHTLNAGEEVRHG